MLASPFFSLPAQAAPLAAAFSQSPGGFQLRVESDEEIQLKVFAPTG
jgi:hypothetical protein